MTLELTLTHVFEEKLGVFSLIFLSRDGSHACCLYHCSFVLLSNEKYFVKQMFILLGATVNVSGIDILDGTPVLDIKPYIPQYDCPALWPSTDGVAANGEPDNDEELADELEKKDDSTVCISSIGSGCDQTMCSEVKRYSRGHMEEFADADCTKLVSTHGNENLSNEQAAGLDFSGKYVNRIDSFEAKFGKIRLGSKQEEIIKCPENDSYVDHRLEDTKVHGGKVVQTEINKCLDDPGSEESVQIGSDKETATDSCDPLFPERTASENSSHTATWITKPNVEKLNVRFTRSAEEQLHLFSEISENKLYSLQYLKHSEVKEAIISILQEDPRSTYRRKHCKDNLYYFTVDIVHVTCWFDETIAEVLRLKPAALVQQCKSEYT